MPAGQAYLIGTGLPADGVDTVTDYEMWVTFRLDEVSVSVGGRRPPAHVAGPVPLPWLFA
jgi:hypothetical protein